MNKYIRLLSVGLCMYYFSCNFATHLTDDQSAETDADDTEKLLVDEVTTPPAPTKVPPLDENNEMVIAASDATQGEIEQAINPPDQEEEDTKACEPLEGSSEEEVPTETGPGQENKGISERPWWMLHWWNPDEGNEPDIHDMSRLALSGPHDIDLYFGGELKDDLFIYTHVNTLRSDYHDQNDFIRHKLNLDLALTQGTKKYGTPASQAAVRLTNYVFWQDEGHYMPFVIDEINLPDLDNPSLLAYSTIPSLNTISVAKNVKVKPLLPLIFVEQAWFKLNFEAFIDTFKNNPTFLKIGYFPYTVGRGVVLGFHDDLAVEYLGWAGDGGFTRYPFMPPGILFRLGLTNNLNWDFYYNLWRETNASLSDDLKPDRRSRLKGPPERGSGKNRRTFITKLNFEKDYEDFGDLYLEPYFVFVDAPEQRIEFTADASSKIFSLGIMADWHHKGWSANFEIAGQGGHQNVHGIDRNIELLGRDDNGNIQTQFSHVLVKNVNGDTVPVHPSSNVQRIKNPTPDKDVPKNDDVFEPYNQMDYLVLNDNNRAVKRQNKDIVKTDGTPIETIRNRLTAFNSNIFGDRRFRRPYRLDYQGFMALADLSYEWDDAPFKLAGSAGYISGDNYPYNEEVDKTFKGFIPLRSRYKGLSNRNFLIFDRMVIPRPLNIAYQTLYAYNDVKDLSNLQFVGLGFTWFPIEDHREKLSVVTDLMFFWEAATLRKWDKDGKYPDPLIEQQLRRLRNTVADDPNQVYADLSIIPKGKATKFHGWESFEHAHRMLGTELDIKFFYQFLDHCEWRTKVSLFIPGQLYKDLAGQPNELTRRVNEHGYLRYNGLGHSLAFAFMTGLEYTF